MKGLQPDYLSPIGGYFELELTLHPELHSRAIALNSGRFCFECKQSSKNRILYI